MCLCAALEHVLCSWVGAWPKEPGYICRWIERRAIALSLGRDHVRLGRDRVYMLAARTISKGCWQEVDTTASFEYGRHLWMLPACPMHHHDPVGLAAVTDQQSD
jgi:hypothetical protein